ncbi:MAG TPA: class I SAM-dependent rRNA methyltransferase [Chthoniobacterales bacterium]|nr:class I SAM-dependent rRNA methyltransferase [Chthoniobacterales bacterium]
MAGIVVRPRSRILHGHDWVFSSEVLKVFGDPADGDVISLKDGRDKMLGSAIWNSKSQIVARRFSHRRQELDVDFFKRRIRQAAEYRARRQVNPELHRVLWSESDGVPGVILDRYGDQFVLQLTTLGMDQRRQILVDAIQGALNPGNIIERSDAVVRRAEGLQPTSGVLQGEARECEFQICGVKLLIDPLSAQKTGFYLDQLPHYPTVAGLAAGKRVLDCFTNEGAFALTCAKAGATEVIGVETQTNALVAARENAKRNQLTARWVEQDVFVYLRAAEKAGAQFDLIILDPPSFTKTKSGIRDAIRGYRELHLRAFKLLSRDGILATFSCSHHISDAILSETISAALVDARRSARRLRRFEQALDHAVLPTMPETEYFRGMLLEMKPSI